MASTHKIDEFWWFYDRVRYGKQHLCRWQLGNPIRDYHYKPKRLGIVCGLVGSASAETGHCVRSASIRCRTGSSWRRPDVIPCGGFASAPVPSTIEVRSKPEPPRWHARKSSSLFG